MSGSLAMRNIIPDKGRRTIRGFAYSADTTRGTTRMIKAPAVFLPKVMRPADVFCGEGDIAQVAEF